MRAETKLSESMYHITCVTREIHIRREISFFIFFLAMLAGCLCWEKKVNETYKVIFIFVIFNESTYYVLFRNRSFKRNARKESWFFFSFFGSLCVLQFTIKTFECRSSRKVVSSREIDETRKKISFTLKENYFKTKRWGEKRNVFDKSRLHNT